MLTNQKKVSVLVFNSFTNDSRVLKESITLSNAGYNVDVIAHLDKGLQKIEKNSLYTVKRISYLDRTNASFLTKIIAYIKFIKGAITESKNSDFLHCNDLNTLPVAFIIKKLYNSSVKVIYDAHEYETEMNSLSPKSKKVMSYFERRLIKYADKTITVSHSIAFEYKKLYPFIDTPELVLNCPKYTTNIKKNDHFRTRFSIEKDSTIFLYQGSLSKGRGLETIIEAFKLTNNKKNILVIMGYGGLEEKVKKTSEEEKNIYFHEAVSPTVLLDYTSSADFGISTIENTCLSYYYCLPNKMFEYIMAEIPLIVSNFPEMKKVVIENSIGVVVKENSNFGILKAIEEASLLDLNLMKVNLKKAKQIYNWENQERVLLNIYATLSL